MKNLIFVLFCALCIIQPLAEGFFFGPVAVGLGVGLLAASGGFLLGASLARTRSRRSYRQSRNYRYQPSHHYSTSHNRWYSQPQQNYGQTDEEENAQQINWRSFEG